MATLNVPCAPKWFGFQFSNHQTTKLLAETRSGTWAKRIYPVRFIRSCSATLNSPFASLVGEGQLVQDGAQPQAHRVLRGRHRARGNYVYIDMDIDI